MSTELNVNQLNLVSVAYVGDAVYSLFVREMLIKKFDCKSGKLHLLSNNYVKASSQSKILDGLMKELTQEELDIVRRARNTHTQSKAKNAGLADYKKATALEGLIGFLFLSQKTQRLEEVLSKCVVIAEQIKEGKSS